MQNKERFNNKHFNSAKNREYQQKNRYSQNNHFTNKDQNNRWNTNIKQHRTNRQSNLEMRFSNGRKSGRDARPRRHEAVNVCAFEGVEYWFSKHIGIYKTKI